MTLRKIILDILYHNEGFFRSGMKATELVAEVMSTLCEKHKDLGVSSEELLNEVEVLIQSGDIIEIDFVVPAMDYRIKSFYLPKDTFIKSIRGLSKEQLEKLVDDSLVASEQYLGIEKKI